MAAGTKSLPLTVTGDNSLNSHRFFLRQHSTSETMATVGLSEIRFILRHGKGQRPAALDTDVVC
jgi:hypothetical protein